jgi:hypothetical protein
MPLTEAEPNKDFKETYINWHPLLRKWGWLIYYVLIFAGFTFFASLHENDFGGLKFVWHSLIAGLVTGVLLFLILKLRFTSWADNKNKSAEIALYTILSSVFLTICLGPLINKNTGTNKTDCREFKLLIPDKKDRNGRKYIHINTGKGKERFMPQKSFLKRLKRTDSLLILCIRKGGLGYEYVHEFKLSGDSAK